MRGTDETKLAERCARGEAKAREELYNEYAARLYSLCRRYVPDSSKARDLMHESLIKALEKIGSFRKQDGGSLYGWLARIAVNTCISDIRKRKVLREVPLEEAGAEVEDPDEEDVGSISPEMLRGFVERLPEGRRVIFNLYCIDGLPHKEIATRLGITTGASTSMLAKAKNELKRMINNYLETK